MAELHSQHLWRTVEPEGYCCLLSTRLTAVARLPPATAHRAGQQGRDVTHSANNRGWPEPALFTVSRECIHVTTGSSEPSW